MKWFQTAQKEISDRVRRLRATDARQKLQKRKEAEPLREAVHGNQRDLANAIERQAAQEEGRAFKNGQDGCVAGFDVFCATATTAASRAPTNFLSHHGDPTTSSSERPLIHRSRTFTDGSNLRGDGLGHTGVGSASNATAQAAATNSGATSGQPSSRPHLLRTASTASAAAYGAAHKSRTPRARKETPVEPSTADTAAVLLESRKHNRPSPSIDSGSTAAHLSSPPRLLRTASTASAATYGGAKKSRTPRARKGMPVEPSTADTAVVSLEPRKNNRPSPLTEYGATAGQPSRRPHLLRTASTASAAAYGAVHKARTPRARKETPVEPSTADTAAVLLESRKNNRPSPSMASGATSGQPSSRSHVLRTASTASAAAYGAANKSRTPRARREMPVEPSTADTASVSLKPRKNTLPSPSKASKVAGSARPVQGGSAVRPARGRPFIAASRPVQDIIRWPPAFPVAGSVTVGDTSGSEGSITPPPARRSSSKRSGARRGSSVPDVSRPSDAAAACASGGRRRNGLPDISRRGIARRPVDRRPPAATRKRTHRLAPRSSSFSSSPHDEAPRLPGYYEAVQSQGKIDRADEAAKDGRRKGGAGTNGASADVAGGGPEEQRQRRASRRDPNTRREKEAPPASQTSPAPQASQAPQVPQVPQGMKGAQGTQATEATEATQTTQAPETAAAAAAKRATRVSQAQAASRVPQASRASPESSRASQPSPQRAEEEGEGEQKRRRDEDRGKRMAPGDLRRALSLGSALRRALSRPLDNEPEPGPQRVGNTTRNHGCEETVDKIRAISSGGSGDILPSADASSGARSKGGVLAAPACSTPVVAKIAKIEVGMIVARGAAAAAAAGIRRTPAGFLDPPPEGVPVEGDGAFSWPPPPCWVTRYLNFASTYGLVYLLSDGSVGLLFKDDTKMVVDPAGATIDYEEPPPTAAARVLSPQSSIHEAESGAGRRARRAPNGWTPSYQYSLDSFPFYLRKKVDILRYFRRIMLFDDGGGGYEGRVSEVKVSEENPRAPLTFVEKWKYAGDTHCFQLSRHTVQVLFSDGTEVMLSKESDPELVTFVSRDGKRETQPRHKVEHRKDVMKRVRCAEDFMFLMMETP